MLQSGFSSSNLLQCPVDRVLLRTFVEPGDKSDHQLAISKNARREVELWTIVTEPSKALHCISHSKSFRFIVSATRAVITTYSDNFLTGRVQNDKSSCSVALLGSAVELDVDVLALLESRLGREVDRSLQRGFRYSHALQNVTRWIHGWWVARLLLHAQLSWSHALFNSNQLRLILHHVNQHSLQLRMSTIRNFQKSFQLR